MAASSLNDVDWSALPAPEDDGAAAHLAGRAMPSIALPATDGGAVDLSTCAGLCVVYAYPKTGQPGTALPDGWDDIPGARGCTPQSCAFRDHADELGGLGVTHLYGLSTQDTAWQSEAAGRMHLPFRLLSDADLALTRALDLPTFEAGGETLLKRFTLIIEDGRIAHVFYPVFPPDQNAADVIAWLAHRTQRAR
ncbi:MAG: peroxiredoxin [Pseudomonadota bacterium]